MEGVNMNAEWVNLCQHRIRLGSLEGIKDLLARADVSASRAPNGAHYHSPPAKEFKKTPAVGREKD
jgi:hypothetical protein